MLIDDLDKTLEAEIPETVEAMIKGIKSNIEEKRNEVPDADEKFSQN